jgi:hypothetical protein
MCRLSAGTTLDLSPSGDRDEISSVRLFMRLIHGSFAGLVLAGILAIAPTAAFAHDGWHGGRYGYGRHCGYGGHYGYRGHYWYGGGYSGLVRTSLLV